MRNVTPQQYLESSIKRWKFKKKHQCIRLFVHLMNNTFKLDHPQHHFDILRSISKVHHSIIECIISHHNKILTRQGKKEIEEQTHDMSIQYTTAK